MGRTDRQPRLVAWYDALRYGGSAADFVSKVTSTYSSASLIKLVAYGDHEQRRAAVAALGMTIGDDQCQVLGKALSDPHRGVRATADRWIPQVWQRIWPAHCRNRLVALLRSVRSDPRSVLVELNGWERIATRHAIVWQLRAQALEVMGCVDEAIECYRIALQMDPFRYTAAWRQANLLMAAEQYGAALRLFRCTAKIFPSHDASRTQIAKLERILG